MKMTGNNLVKKSNESLLSLFLSKRFILQWILFVVGVVPFLLLVCYAHPQADDWYQSDMTLKQGFVGANVSYYSKITGRYFSNLLIFAHPMLFSFLAFKIYCLFFLVVFIMLTFWAVSRWFPSGGVYCRITLSLVFLVAFFGGMPSPAQAFYWQTALAGYFVPILLFLWLIAILGRECLLPAWQPTVTRVIGCCLLALFIAGCSEIAMALLLLAMVVLNLASISANSRVSWPMLAMLACTVVGIAIVMAAPANDHRIRWYSNDVHHVPLKALAMALELGLKQTLVWVSLGLLLPVTLVLMAGWPVEVGITRRRAWAMILWASLLITGTVFGGFFVGTWSMGDYLPLRSTNQLYFFFLLGWFVLAGGVASLLRSHGWHLPRLSSTFGVLAFFLFVGIVAVGSSHPIWGGACNIKNAWKDLIYGDAAAFDKECYARYELIRSAQADEVTVPRLRSRPSTIFYTDLHNDPANWRNLGMAAFFHKRRLLLEPQK